MLIYSDYIDNSKIIIYSINETNLYEIYLKYSNNVNYGKLTFDNKNKEYIKYIPSNIYLFSLNGTFYSTNIPITLLLFKKNIDDLENINIFTSITSIILQKNSLKNLYKNKIGFDIDTYNFYKNDYYYDYFYKKDKYSLICIKLCAIIIFIWNIIYNLLIKHNINIDFSIYDIFYKLIYDNLDDLTNLLSKYINVYFMKYNNNLIPYEYDNIIKNWTKLINNENDLIKILIYQQSSIVLKIEYLNEININKLFEILDYNITKERFINIIDKLYYTKIDIIKPYCLNIINKNHSFLKDWESLNNLGTRNKGLYLKKDKVLLKRDSKLISQDKIEMYIYLNNNYQYFPKLYNIYNINNNYYYESERLDFDLHNLFREQITSNLFYLIPELNNNFFLKNKIINIFLYKYNYHKIDAIYLKLYINNYNNNNNLLNNINYLFSIKENNKDYIIIEINNKKYKILNDVYKSLNSNFNKINELLLFFKENEINIDIFKLFMDNLYIYYKNEFINIIKNIGLLEYNLYKIDYFVDDFHKLENFGCKTINGIKKYYIIDWEYIIKIYDNKEIHLDKIIKILNMRSINDNKHLLSPIFYNIEKYDIYQDIYQNINQDINQNILNLLQYEKYFIDDTPLICNKENMNYDEKLNEILNFIQ